MARFRNDLLCDPISRVAREPFRKLKPNDRLIGAAQLCLAAGVVPKNLMIGIMAAFVYENPGDPDFNIVHLIRALNPRDFLKIIIRLREGEALFQMLLDRWEENRRLLGEIRS